MSTETTETKALADPRVGGRQGRASPVQILSFSLGVGAPVMKILDPQLKGVEIIRQILFGTTTNGCKINHRLRAQLSFPVG